MQVSTVEKGQSTSEADSPRILLHFFDGVAEVVNRKTFLDVDVKSPEQEPTVES